MNKFITLLIIAITVISCKTSAKGETNNETPLREHYLLTNEISMKGREVAYGASSYLVELDNTVYLCTAKHLTRSAMGFNPPIDLETYSDSVNYWIAYPRSGKIKDSIFTAEMYYNDDIMDDLILFSIKQKPENISVLQPSFTKLKKGETVRILGCEYSETDCSQKSYFATINQYTITDQIEIYMDSSDVDVSGFSGAPVLNSSNKVIGHILAGGNFGDGIMKLYLAPISWAKKVKI